MMYTPRTVESVRRDLKRSTDELQDVVSRISRHVSGGGKIVQAIELHHALNTFLRTDVLYRRLRNQSTTEYTA